LMFVAAFFTFDNQFFNLFQLHFLVVAWVVGGVGGGPILGTLQTYFEPETVALILPLDLLI
jgi:hypothetical protein